MRIALPRSEASARRVHQHTIKLGFGRQFFTAIPNRDAVIESFGTSGAVFEFFQPPLDTVTRVWETSSGRVRRAVEQFELRLQGIDPLRGFGLGQLLAEGIRLEGLLR